MRFTVKRIFGVFLAFSVLIVFVLFVLFFSAFRTNWVSVICNNILSDRKLFSTNWASHQFTHLKFTSSFS